MKLRYLPIFNSCLAAALIATACSGGSSTKSDKEEQTVYKAGIVSESGNSDLEQGFKDALTDMLGSDHIEIDTVHLTKGDESDAVNELREKGDSLILTESESSLSSAYAALKNDKDASIISVNVQDIFRATGTEEPEDKDDRKTGINVTGISSNPYVSDQLSELIEATPDLKSVGIIYSPDDTDVVKSDRTLENFLTQAGIEYREYILPSKVYRSLLTDKTDTSSATLLNSIRNSDEIDPTVPQMSEGFAKHIHPDYDDARLLKWEKAARKSLLDASDQKIIDAAVKQNDALYIAGGSCSGKISDIVKAAKQAGVSTFGGDHEAGEKTLVTLWSDPYDSGYQAGKMAVRVLSGGEKASDLPYQYRSRTSFVKLYNKDYADKLGLTFGKSFHEYSEYLKDYTPGSNTTRIEGTEG